MFTKASVLAVLASMAAAQTSTSCNPTEKTCPDDAAVGGNYTIDFTKGANDFFTVADGTTLTYDDSLGAVFSISSDTDAPTISSNGYIFFGRVELTVRVAPGAGIVTSSVLQSDDLDEIDWEWIGSVPDEVQTNFFSKGNTSTYDRGGFTEMSDAVDTFHTYTIDWTTERIEWILDGTVVRTLTYADAEAKWGYPQSPMQIKLGSWVGGSATASEGTVEWAGGRATYDDAPYNAYYQKVVVYDYMGGNSSAKSYSYTDLTGAWQSIGVSQEEVANTTSTSSESASSLVQSSTANGTTTSSNSSSSSSGSASSSGSSSSSTGSAVSGANKLVSGSVVAGFAAVAALML